MKSYRDRAIVLRTYKLGEADRIIVLLTEQKGQIRAVAKGIRKPTSRFGARLAPFNLVDMQLHKGRAMDTITQADLIAGYGTPVAAQYPNFAAAKVMVEAAQKLTDGVAESQAEHFALLHGGLAALAGGRIDPAMAASSYLLRSMSLAGWTPSFGVCAVCGATEGLRSFSPEAGGFVCSACLGQGALAVPPGTRDLVEALMRSDWKSVEMAPAAAKAYALTVATQWTEWHVEQRLRSVEHLRSEQR